MTTLKPMELAGEIVKSFVENNSVPRADLAGVIEAIHAAVKKLAEGGEVAPVVVDAAVPAISIRKSITPDCLICLEDGKRFKSLARHLATHGMTPEQYREKWNLPSSYPMVAANFSAQRSALAKTLGLGQWRGKSVAAPLASVAATVPELTNDRAIELASSEPASVPNRKVRAKAKMEVADTIPAGAMKRKRGRPAKVFA